MLPGNYTPKFPEKLPLSNSPWDNSTRRKHTGGRATALPCLGERPPHRPAVQRGRSSVAGTERTFARCNPFWGLGGKGGKRRAPQHALCPACPCTCHQARLQPPCLAQSLVLSTFLFLTRTHDAEQSARGCARDDRLCTDVHYMIIIIILPRIHDERDDCDGYKEALGSRGCRQGAARSFFRSALRSPAPSHGCSWLCLGPAIA